MKCCFFSGPRLRGARFFPVKLVMSRKSFVKFSFARIEHQKSFTTNTTAPEVKTKIIEIPEIKLSPQLTSCRTLKHLINLFSECFCELAEIVSYVQQ